VQPTRFAAGHSETYTVYLDCVDDFVYNEITVYGDIPDEYCNLPNPPVEATASDQCECGFCDLDCSKDVEPSVSKAGHDVVYTICAINTGDLCDLTLVQVTCTETATVQILHPSIYVDVECLTDPVPEGQDGEFGVTVENTGDVTLEVTTDWMMFPSFTLTPGQVFYEIATAPCEGSEACFAISVLGVLPEMYGLDNQYPGSDEECCPCPGDNGCTPGFWKNHEDCWCDRFAPTDLLGDVFVVPSPELDDYADDTLREGIRYGGGSGLEGAVRNLFRSAVAAILNGCSPDVPYPMSADAVINAVNAALATLDRGEILALHTELDILNNLGCSIDAHCRPIEDDPDKGLLEDHSGEIMNPAESKSGFSSDEVWSQPVPNPFMGTTTINFGLPKSGDVAIDVYDVAGRHVATVLSGAKDAGTHEAVWNGRNSNGAQVPAGVYFYRFTFDNEILMKKMLVVK
jgi:hypothetical protein